MNPHQEPSGSAEPAATDSPNDRHPNDRHPDDRHPDGNETGAAPREIGGRKGLEPTRYGDWEKNGRCIDF